MISKRIILVLSCFLILISVLGVCAMDNQHEIHDIQQVLNETNASEKVTHHWAHHSSTL